MYFYCIIIAKIIFNLICIIITISISNYLLLVGNICGFFVVEVLYVCYSLRVRHIFLVQFFRYQMFLQLKQDILSGKLECPLETAIELAGYALQCMAIRMAIFCCYCLVSFIHRYFLFLVLIYIYIFLIVVSLQSAQNFGFKIVSVKTDKQFKIKIMNSLKSVKNNVYFISINELKLFFVFKLQYIV